MMQKASEIIVCVFTNTPTNLAYEFNAQGEAVDVNLQNLTPEEQLVWGRANEAANDMQIKYGFNVRVNICPMDYGNNAPIAYQNKIVDLPGLLITGKYPDGSARQYAIAKNLSEKFLGINWSAADIFPYYKALYLQQFGDGSKCILPAPLCNLPAIAWLVAAGLATYKATEQTGGLRIMWGGGAAVAWHQFMQAGGFAAVKDFKL